MTQMVLCSPKMYSQHWIRLICVFVIVLHLAHARNRPYRRPINFTIKCLKVGQLFAHAIHCNQYWKCDRRRLATLQMCPPHQRIDLDLKKCVLKTKVECN